MKGLPLRITFTILGHSARQGCSRCTKSFPGTIGNMDFSGFDRSLWRTRTNEEHRSQMYEINNWNSKGDRDKLESKYGTCYSVLTELTYYDSIGMAIVDPMHNLFLGKPLFRCF